MMIKALFTTVFSLTVLLCSAQKQLLTYQDFQYILQNNTEQVDSFLQQKDYHKEAAFNTNETHFFALFADADYSDLTIKVSGRNKTATLVTTHNQQVEDLQKALNLYSSKSSKGIKTYRVKDGKVGNVTIAESGSKPNTNTIYTIQLQN